MASFIPDSNATKPSQSARRQTKMKSEPQISPTTPTPLTATSLAIDDPNSSIPPTPQLPNTVKTENVSAFTLPPTGIASTPKRVMSNVPSTLTPMGTPSANMSLEPASPASSASRKGKGGRRAANPHLTDEERRRERVLKNRESAMKSLQKKKRYTEDLEARARVLARRNAELKEKIRALLIRLNGVPSIMHQLPNASNLSNNPYLAASLGFPTTGIQHGALSQQRNIQSQTHQQQPQYQQPLHPLQAQVQIQAAAQQFAQVDQWVPGLSEAIASQGNPSIPSASSYHPTVNMSEAMSNTNIHPNTTAGMRVGMVSPRRTQPDIGEPFSSLGMNLNFGLGSTAPSPNSPVAALQNSLLDSSFSLGPDVGEKIGQSLDIHNMACP